MICMKKCRVPFSTGGTGRCGRSEQFRKPAEGGGRPWQPLPFEGVEVFRHGQRRAPQALPLLPGRRADEVRGHVKHLGHELVRVLCDDPVLGQRMFREVREVTGHDHVRARADGGGEYVTVVGVGEDQGLDQVLVARD